MTANGEAREGSVLTEKTSGMSTRLEFFRFSVHSNIQPGSTQNHCPTPPDEFEVPPKNSSSSVDSVSEPLKRPTFR